MNMQDFVGWVQVGYIDVLYLVLLEGGIYVLEVQMGDCVYLVEDDFGQLVSLCFVEYVCQVLCGLNRVLVELVCVDVDDEMCGFLVELGLFIGGLLLLICQG